MAGLKRSVLAVVDERQELSRLVVKVTFPGTQGPDDARGDERHRGTAALRRQLGQLGEVTAACLLIRRAAAQAEPERTRYVRRVSAFAWPDLASSHIHLHGLGQELEPGRIDCLTFHRVVGQPRVRQPTFDQYLLQGCRPGLFIADEQVAAYLVPATGVVVSARSVLAARRPLRAARHH